MRRIFRRIIDLFQKKIMRSHNFLGKSQKISRILKNQVKIQKKKVKKFRKIFEKFSKFFQKNSEIFFWNFFSIFFEIFFEIFLKIFRIFFSRFFRIFFRFLSDFFDFSCFSLNFDPHNFPHNRAFFARITKLLATRIIGVLTRIITPPLPGAGVEADPPNESRVHRRRRGSL